MNHFLPNTAQDKKRQSMTNSQLEFSRTTMTKMSLSVMVRWNYQVSSIIFYVQDDGNTIKVTVVGKRKREMGLVFPGKYDCYTKNKKTAMLVDKELQKRKEKF